MSNANTYAVDQLAAYNYIKQRNVQDVAGAYADLSDAILNHLSPIKCVNATKLYLTALKVNEENRFVFQGKEFLHRECLVAYILAKFW